MYQTTLQAERQPSSPKPESFFSTEGASEIDALSLWQSLLESLGLRGKVLLPEKAGFSAVACGRPFGKARLYRYETTPLFYERTSGDCANNPSDLFLLSYIVKGSVFVRQRKKETLVNQEDVFLLYMGEPCSLSKKVPTEIMSFLLPRTMLQRWLPDPFDMTATSLLKTSPFGSPLASLIKALTLSSMENLAVTPDAVVEQICCLLALIDTPSKVAPSRYKQAFFQRLCQSLHLHCCDTNFNEATLAKKYGVSTRTVQTAFSSAGTTFVKELLSIRMEKAKRFLDDPRYGKQSITEIARLLGYHHASHFIAHFRRMFGVPPAMYRKTKRA